MRRAEHSRVKCLRCTLPLRHVSLGNRTYKRTCCSKGTQSSWRGRHLTLNAKYKCKHVLLGQKREDHLFLIMQNDSSQYTSLSHRESNLLSPHRMCSADRVNLYHVKRRGEKKSLTTIFPPGTVTKRSALMQGISDAF